MKQAFAFIAVGLILALLAGCAPVAELRDFEQIGDGAALRYNGTTYTFYGAKPASAARGAQIGIVDGDPKHKVFSLEGYSSDDWVVEYYDVIMSVYCLYKAEHVSEIPEQLQLD